MAGAGLVPWHTHALAATTPLAISITYASNTLFSFHVAAMVFSFLFILPEAIILFRNAKQFKNRTAVVRYHMWLQLGGLSMALGGFAAMYMSRKWRGKKHFTNIHGWLGVLSLVSAEVIGLAGMLLNWGLPKRFRKYSGRIMKAHRTAGRLVFYIAVATVLSALKVFDKSHKRHKGILTYFFVAMLIGLGISLQPVLWSRVTVSRSPSLPTLNVDKRAEPGEIPNEGQS